MNLLILPGDGVGPEITAAALNVLRAASACFDLRLLLEADVVGHASVQRYGTTVRGDLLEKAKAVDGVVLGPTSSYEHELTGQPGVNKFFRKGLDLFANIRPARTYAGLPNRVGDFDLVVVRENTEGFYADRNVESGSSEILVTPDVAIAMRRITRPSCERIARTAFELAMRRRRHVTIVHKESVLKVTDGMFMEECRRVSRDFPEVTVSDLIVDAAMAHVVRAPDRFDVMVTTNMFGDILSDLTAELTGSIGMAGSLNAGVEHALAQPGHGSALDLAGQDVANPISQILSVALLLEWYGRRKSSAAHTAAAAAIEDAVARCIADKQVTIDAGGPLGTIEVGDAIANRVRDLAAA
ncbi:isocitrate/isopropylmalate family dehydrogenase [Ensifer adhaerens]|uniref:isocitrate/isopropylmalate dehydrogenase family protein n=1 Tax=Ensifer adhaerens TaxID=106592 RepID=UPI0023A9D6B9|nr:isocitrate/isopropylmalate family dehydrogenase [Ensifer adhaerens]WDZ76236.1 isocitrate/isopropylmalate family dehydrogenase [Ensifer adhaerens]